MPGVIPDVALIGSEGGSIQSDGAGGLKVSGTVTTTSSGVTDRAASGALGALNAVVSVALAGHATAGFHLAAGTLAATLTPVLSFDGGVTWIPTVFHDPAAGSYSSNLVLTNPNAAQNFGIRVGGGVTHVGVQVSAYTSGTANATVTATAASPNPARGQMSGANSQSVVPASDVGPVVIAATPAAYRSAVTAADVIANPGTVTTSLLTGVGSAPAGTYNVKVVAGNQYGRTLATAGSGTVVTTGANLAGRAAFAQVTGATYYDVYFSTDADPKWVGRVTETQRASGIIINGVGTTTAGGTAGAVDIYVAGTGLQAATTAAQNTAYVLPADVDATGKQYVDFDLTPSRTGDGASLAVTVIPFFLNSRLSRYFAGDPKTMVFGGTSGAYNSLPQSYRVEARGRHVALAFASIVGTGASFDVDATPS